MVELTPQEQRVMEQMRADIEERLDREFREMIAAGSRALAASEPLLRPRDKRATLVTHQQKEEP